MRQFIRFPFLFVVVMTATALTWISMPFAQERPGNKAAVEKVPTPTATSAALPQSGPVAEAIAAPPTAPTNVVPPGAVIYHPAVRTTPGPEHSLNVIAVGPHDMISGHPKSQEDRELEMKSRELAVKYRDLKDESERKALFTELGALVTKQFNLRQKTRDDELKQLADQLKKLQAIQEKREAARTAIIAERLNQLLLESQGLNWGAAPLVQQPPRGAPVAVDEAGVGFRSLPITETRAVYSNRPLPTPVPDSVEVEEVKIFKIRGVATDATEIMSTIETLLGTGFRRPNVVISTLGAKIVARGSREGVTVVGDLIDKLQDETNDTDLGSPKGAAK